MRQQCQIGGRWIGGEAPVFIVADVGINHNGDMATAKRMVTAARESGCDAVLWQKCAPELHMTPRLAERPLDTPWGAMTFLEYRRRLEFDAAQFQELAACCRSHRLAWGVAVRDELSADFVGQLQPDYLRLSTTALTDETFLGRVGRLGRPVMLCTGMASLGTLRRALTALGKAETILLPGGADHPPLHEKIRARYWRGLEQEFDCPLGSPGPTISLTSTLAAVALGASVVERPLTLDRSAWGINHALSAEPAELRRLALGVRSMERASMARTANAVEGAGRPAGSPVWIPVRFPGDRDRQGSNLGRAFGAQRADEAFGQEPKLSRDSQSA